MPPIDPAVARFLAIHSKPPREAVEEDVAEFRGKTLEEIGQAISACCRTAIRIVEASPMKDRILAYEEPPHPSYPGIIARLRSR